MPVLEVSPVINSEDQEIRNLVKDIRQKFEQWKNLSNFLNDDSVLTSTLQLRLTGLEMIIQDKTSLEELKADYRKTIDLFKEKTGLMDLIPILEKLEIYVLEDTWKYTLEGELPGEKQLKKLRKLTFKDFLTAFLLPPTSSLPMAHLFKLSLQLEALLVILIQIAKEHLSISGKQLSILSNAFRDIGHKYMIQFNLLRPVLIPGKSRNLRWGWEGAIEERRTSVEVQHELLDWRAKS